MTANEIEQKAKDAYKSTYASDNTDLNYQEGFVAGYKSAEADRDKFAVELLDWLIEHHYIDGFLFETTQDILEQFKNREK